MKKAFINITEQERTDILKQHRLLMENSLFEQSDEIESTTTTTTMSSGPKFVQMKSIYTSTRCKQAREEVKYIFSSDVANEIANLDWVRYIPKNVEGKDAWTQLSEEIFKTIDDSKIECTYNTEGAGCTCTYNGKVDLETLKTKFSK